MQVRYRLSDCITSFIEFLSASYNFAIYLILIFRLASSETIEIFFEFASRNSIDYFLSNLGKFYNYFIFFYNFINLYYIVYSVSIANSAIIYNCANLFIP